MNTEPDMSHREDPAEHLCEVMVRVRIKHLPNIDFCMSLPSVLDPADVYKEVAIAYQVPIENVMFFRPDSGLWRFYNGEQMNWQLHWENRF